MAEITLEITPRNFRIGFHPETLLRTAEGATTAFIYWQFDDFYFPGPRWSDFVAVIPGWWIEALRGLDGPKELRFMDGPYFIRVSKSNDAHLSVGCYEDRAERKLCGSYVVRNDAVLKEVEATARDVVAAFQERNWNSEDIAYLKRLLSRA
jgi:hypothetical protein